METGSIKIALINYIYIDFSPAILRRLATLSSIGGWVEKRLLNPLRALMPKGLAMKRWAVALLACFMGL